MATATKTKIKTRTSTKTIVVGALAVGFAAAAALGYDWTQRVQQPSTTIRQPVTSKTLTVTFDGPPSNTYYPGPNPMKMYDFYLRAAAGKDIEIRSLHLSLAGANGAKTIGSAGTKYFKNLKIVNLSTGVVMMGPMELSPTTNRLDFKDAFVLKGGDALFLSLVTEFSYKEDAPGEFFGNKYNVTLNPFSDGDVYVGTTGQTLSTTLISPNTDLSGNYMTIGAPPSKSSATVSVVIDPLTPSSNIAVAGDAKWVPFARYTVKAAGEGVKMEKIALKLLPGGDAADFNSLAIASDSVILGQSYTADNWTVTDIDLSQKPLIVPNNQTKTFEVWGKLKNTLPSSAANGSWTGICRSGHQPALAIADGSSMGTWDANYTSKLNIKFTGASSLGSAYADMSNTAGRQQVVRKSKPYVTTMPLANNVLFNGFVELHRLRVGADAAGPIALKQMMFKVAKTGPMINVGNFRLFRGAMQIPASEYTIVDAMTGADLKSGKMATGTPSTVIAVAFTGEDMISGSGNLYSLQAEVTGATAGATVKTDFVRDPKASVITGGLATNVQTALNVANPKIYTVSVAKPTAIISYPGTFLWSDMSEVPHFASGNASIDWTNDVYVENFGSSLLTQ